MSFKFKHLLICLSQIRNYRCWRFGIFTIVRRRQRRGDSAAVFSCLADLPHRAWTGAPNFALDQLAGQRDNKGLDDVHGNGCLLLKAIGDDVTWQRNAPAASAS